MINKVANKMIEYYGSDVRRINHFLKVHSFASIIAKNENVDKRTLEIIEIAAYTHDIGIKLSEQKYNSSAGKYQELEGPVEAMKLFKGIGLDSDIAQRVCYIIGHHHTYDNIDSIDYQIVVEADFIVNLYEDNASKSAVQSAYDNIFKTKSGKHIIETMYY